MTDRVLGSCSICGGSVIIPHIWYGVIPPIPTCISCGATQKNKLPVIDMEKKRDSLK